MNIVLKVAALLCMSHTACAGLIYGLEQIKNESSHVHYPAYVQMGSFPTQQRAEQFQHHVRLDTKIPVNIESAPNRYRVRVGPFLNQNALQAFCRDMPNKKYIFRSTNKQHRRIRIVLIDNFIPKTNSEQPASLTPSTSKPPVISKPTRPGSGFSLINVLKKIHAKKSIQVGGFVAHQGTAQDINIEGLVGDHFSVSNHNPSNALVGAGYYVDGQETDRFNLSYGINAFYLPKTTVSGLVTQEKQVTNLSYQYSITHYPIYFGAKALIKNKKSDRYTVTLDAGLGPNITSTSSVTETSLDGFTIPDKTYSGRTTATFSAMAGLGIQMNNAFGQTPLECGYRFFYLGQGAFNSLSNQLLNGFNTGHNYANALVCTLTK